MVNDKRLNGSIVDYLKSRGFQQEAGERFPYFNQRKKMYSQKGLDTTFGSFSGSAEQNTALLRELQTSDIQPQTQAQSILAGAGAGAGTEAKSAGRLQLEAEAKEMAQYGRVLSPEERASMGGGGESIIPDEIRPPTTTPTIPETTPDTTAQDILDRVRNRPDIILAQDASEAQKQEVQAGVEPKQEAIRQESAERGTTFSPRFTDQPVDEVLTEAISKQLGIDRSFAEILNRAIQQESDAMQQEQEQATEADFRALEALGLVRLPDGSVVPSFKREQWETELEEEPEAKEPTVRTVGGKLYQYNYETGEWDLAISPSLAQGASVGGTNYNTIKEQLEGSMGTDGYVNTDVYKTLRTKAKSKSEFDDNFSYMLNPDDQSAQAFALNGTTTGSEFTPTQKNKLEQAGLLDASRKDQLDHLYGEGVEEDEAKTFEEGILNYITALKEQGFKRDEAEKGIREESEKAYGTPLPDFVDDLIKDTLVDIYGKTFFQKVIPFGR